MLLSRLDHLVLTTRDIDACVDFYTRILGMRSKPLQATGWLCILDNIKLIYIRPVPNSAPMPLTLFRAAWIYAYCWPFPSKRPCCIWKKWAGRLNPARLCAPVQHRPFYPFIFAIRMAI